MSARPSPARSAPSRSSPSRQPSARPTLRCAIYTRVSTEHGLEQEFNSLDNQREAAEAYVRSQAHEGWRLLPGRYDDGGFSGGSLERPALQRLLEDVRAGRVDVIVVYKVDRLTRALSDFARLVELFDAHGVSFVSVTQAFNTTTSMGRLTLNVLLSFAQFEREVTGERIRDKIAASKRKGIWMGGVVPLGYRVEARKLVIDEAEATIVRSIFERYLALGSLPALQAELRSRGVVSRRRPLSSGRIAGGTALTNGPLAHLLRNRVYLGEINHCGASYPGEHPAIIASEIFEAVQATLDANLAGTRTARAASGALLLGRIYDDRGNRMTPSHTRKGSRLYRYYVSAMLAQGRGAEAGTVRRIPAARIEALGLHALRQRDGGDQDDRALVATRLLHLVVHSDRVVLTLVDDSTIEEAWAATARPARGIVADVLAPSRTMKAEARSVLLRQAALGRRWLAGIVAGTATTESIAQRMQLSARHVERAISLAFLAPDILAAAAAGSLPRGAGVAMLADAPASWAKQRQLLAGQR